MTWQVLAAHDHPRHSDGAACYRTGALGCVQASELEPGAKEVLPSRQVGGPRFSV
jgi:hypothetical protein